MRISVEGNLRGSFVSYTLSVFLVRSKNRPVCRTMREIGTPGSLMPRSNQRSDGLRYPTNVVFVAADTLLRSSCRSLRFDVGLDPGEFLLRAFPQWPFREDIDPLPGGIPIL